MKKNIYYLSFTAILAALVIFSFTLISCPPVDEDPIDSTVVVTGELTLNKWNDVLADIYSKGVYVNLDLSACTVPASDKTVLKRSRQDGADYESSPGVNKWDDYIQFNPSLSSKFGKEYITSIILPNVATMINNASDQISIENIEEAANDETDRYAFRHFTKLNSIKGQNIRLIGTFAFYNCGTLTEAKFPNVNHIMQYAFYNCSSVKKFDFEKLTDILPSAFEGCSSLERVDFHNVRIISNRAFKNCSSLKEVNFSSAMRVELEAFRDCKNLKTARFLADPNTPPSGTPLDPWIANKNTKPPHVEDSVAFHNNVFKGCTSLEILDIRKAWNVYFGAGALADIGTSLTLWLYDSSTVRDTNNNNKRSFGHPQVELLLGGTHPDMDIGKLTLKSLIIITNVVDPYTDAQIFVADSDTDDGTSSIRNRINTVYNPGDRYPELNEPKNPVVKVTVNGRPSISNP